MEIIGTQNIVTLRSSAQILLTQRNMRRKSKGMRVV